MASLASWISHHEFEPHMSIHQVDDPSMLINIATHIDTQSLGITFGHSTNSRYSSYGKIAHKLPDRLALKLELVLSVGFVFIRADLGKHGIGCDPR